MDLKQQIEDFKNIYYHYSKRTWEWEPFMKKYKMQYVCEVGVRNGQNFAKIIQHKPALAVAVDAWIDDGSIGNNDGCYQQHEMNLQFNNVKKEFGKEPFVRIVRAYSDVAAHLFPDDFFDFVYIDANHTEEGCYQDMVKWFPKVSQGGLLCGHDYEPRNVRTKRGRIKFGVIEAVDKFAKENNLEVNILPPIVWGIFKP